MQLTMARIYLAVLFIVVVLLPQETSATGELSWVGRIETRPSAGVVGTWVVQGHTFKATSTTQIQEQFGSLSVGACAEVQYVSLAGTDTATKIARESDAPCGGPDTGGEQKVYALIQTVPPGNIGIWQIGGQSYTSNASTTLKQEHGSFAAGVCAEVEFSSANSINTAKSISTQEQFNCSNGTFLSRAVGTIGTFPAGLIGTWQIGGVSYAATSSTSFQQRTPFAVGSCVKVGYFVQNGVNVAAEIESEGVDNCSNTPPTIPTDLRKLYAPIEILPASPFIGAWRIGGVDLAATAATSFDQTSLPFAAGVCVEAKYVIESSVNRLVSVESKPLTRCQVGSITVLRAYGSVNSFPVGLFGTWVVGGLSYQTTPSTVFEQSFGRFAVGAFVEIVYQVSGGNRIATSIETHVVPGDGRSLRVGALESRPSDDTGSWVIGGIPYKGDDAIEIELELKSRPAFAVSAAAPLQVMVNSYQAADGTQFATSVSAVYQNYMPILWR